MSFLSNDGVGLYGAVAANLLVTLYYVGLLVLDSTSRLYYNYCALFGYLCISLASLGQVLNLFMGTVTYLFVFGFALVAIYFLARCYDNLTEVTRVV